MIGDFIRKMETNKDKNINQGLNAKLKKNSSILQKKGRDLIFFLKGDK